MPNDVVRDCALHAPPAASGVAALKSACPQLEDALKSVGLDRMLYEGWQQHLNRDALRDLVRLVERYGGSKPGRSPDMSALPGVLAALARDQTPLPTSWWGAFKTWLKAWWSRHSDSFSWLDRWLEHLGQSASLFNVISYSLLAVVAAVALAVVVNELKAGGLLRPGRRSARTPRVAWESASAAESAAAEEAQPQSLGRRLTDLLRMLVNRMMQTRRLEAERSLTHRELVARGIFDSESQRAVFAAVAGAAESITYGSMNVETDDLDVVLGQGRVLLTQLTEAPGAQ
jgi:hypothetical protein